MGAAGNFLIPSSESRNYNIPAKPHSRFASCSHSSQMAPIAVSPLLASRQAMRSAAVARSLAPAVSRTCTFCLQNPTQCRLQGR
jgi:hypothetical protein